MHAAGKKTETPRWTFLDDGKYPMPPEVQTIPETAAHVAARAIAAAGREVMPGKLINELMLRLKPAPALVVKEDRAAVIMAAHVGTGHQR